LELIKAIEKKDISVVDSILSLEHDGNILVNIDSLGDTAIYKLLLSGSDALLALVANYIASNSEIIKLDIYSVQNKIRIFVSDNIEIFCH